MHTDASQLMYTPPLILSERDNEMLGTRIRAASYDALACSDMNYAAAGVSFVQAGNITNAMHSGVIVASMEGRFSKLVLLQGLRKNIAESARKVAGIVFPRLKEDLKLPLQHVIGYSVEASVLQVANRGSRRLTAHVFRAPGADCEGFYGEINIDLYNCQAHILLKQGERWGCGLSLLPEDASHLQADTYSDLCSKVADTFNQATCSTR